MSCAALRRVERVSEVETDAPMWGVGRRLKGNCRRGGERSRNVPHLIDVWCQGKSESFCGDGLACLKACRAEREIHFDFVLVFAAVKDAEGQNMVEDAQRLLVLTRVPSTHM